MYAEYLRYSGYRVACAENGEQAVEMARSLSPRVIVMDLSLPVMDGWEATRILKTDPATRDIWIVAVTGHGEPQYIERARAAGVDDFALKPLTPDQLLTKIRAGVGANATRTSGAKGEASDRPDKSRKRPG